MRGIVRTVVGWFAITSEQGATAIEYGILVAVMGLVIIVLGTRSGVFLTMLFTYIGKAISVWGG